MVYVSRCSSKIWRNTHRREARTCLLSVRLQEFRFTCQPGYRRVLAPPLNVTRIRAPLPLSRTFACRAALSNVVKARKSPAASGYSASGFADTVVHDKRDTRGCRGAGKQAPMKQISKH